MKNHNITVEQIMDNLLYGQYDGIESDENDLDTILAKMDNYRNGENDLCESEVHGLNRFDYERELEVWETEELELGI
ncbi:MAG TPA: hypothetical protein VIK86_07970 [Candidatus Paceibacterota bacterium]